MKTFLLAIAVLIFLKGATQTNTSDTVMSKLNAVTVVSQKPFVQVQVDKTVMNIDSRPVAAGQNALELLKAAPGVVVDGNENIKMGGKTGVNVLVDGRNLNMSAEDLAQLLKTIEAENIKSIEIIANPSARYDAAGNAGIINIRLKKSITNGLNGSLGAAYQQSIHARGNANASINFRKNKWNWYATGAYNKGLQTTIANNDRTASVKNYVQRSLEGDDFHGNNIRTGVDYTINKKSTLGVLWMNNNRNTTMDNNSQTLLQQINAPDTLVNTRSVAPFTNSRNNLNLNYKYSNNGQELNADVDYTNFASSLYNNVNNELLNKSNLKFDNNATQNNTDVAIRIGSVKLDYSKKLAGNASLEMGLKSVVTRTVNHLDVLNTGTTGWQQDTGKTNVFRYRENVHAAYVSLNKTIRKFVVQGGLRAEYTNVNGRSTNLKNEQINNPDTSYINLFPTVFVQYNLSSKHQFGINYGKRIDRPSYQDQNPFIYVLDAFNSEVGNPYLLPQITHAIEASYTYNYATSIKLKYAVTNNYIEQMTYQNGSKIIMVPQNAGNRKMLNLSMGASFQPAKWWNAYCSAEPYWQQYNTVINGYGSYATNRQSSLGFNGYLGNWFSLPRNIKAELSGWFNYQNTTTIYTSKPIGSMNIGFSKNLFAGKATLKMAVNDVFNTQRWQQTVNTVNLYMVTYRKWESRNLSVSFTFRFGNNKIKEARERNTGSENETDRIKSK